MTTLHTPKNRRAYKAFLFAMQRGRCFYCQAEGNQPQDFTFDHVIPQAVSPELRNCRKNIVLACYLCNLKKGQRLEDTALIVIAQEREIPCHCYKCDRASLPNGMLGPCCQLRQRPGGVRYAGGNKFANTPVLTAPENSHKK